MFDGIYYFRSTQTNFAFPQNNDVYFGHYSGGFMVKLETLVKNIKKHKGFYYALANEIGITYSQLYRVVSGRTVSPKLSVWNALQKWGKK